jgi:hypothetical protein
MLNSQTYDISFTNIPSCFGKTHIYLWALLQGKEGDSIPNFMDNILEVNVPTGPAATPPAKSGANLVILLVCVIVVIAVITVVILLSTTEDNDESSGIPTLTYDEFVNDVETNEGEFTVTFKSFEPGDELRVKGTVRDVRLAEVPSGASEADPGTYTVIFFENPYETQWDNFAYEGDLKSDYTAGEEGTVPIHIQRVTIRVGSDIYYSEYPAEFLDTSGLEDYMEFPTAVIEFTETSPGNYTGSVTSTTDVIRLGNVLIEIWDVSESYAYGTDDGDLTDDDPEEITTGDGEAYLEFWDENDNDRMDSGDTLMFYNTGPGDIMHIYDTVSWNFIADYTVN